MKKYFKLIFMVTKVQFLSRDNDVLIHSQWIITNHDVYFQKFLTEKKLRFFKTVENRIAARSVEEGESSVLPMTMVIINNDNTGTYQNFVRYHDENKLTNKCDYPSINPREILIFVRKQFTYFLSLEVSNVRYITSKWLIGLGWLPTSW